jgi:hypothetical protein
LLTAEFDPTKVPKGTGNKGGKFHVRYMTPFTVQCLNCGEFMGAGRKFNATIETCNDRDYLGEKIYRIIYKCTWCSQTFTLLTNPKAADYTVESGVKRMSNHMDAKQAEERASARAADQAEAEGGVSVDAMRALEARTEEAREQLQAMDALEELQAVRAAQAAVAPDDVIAAVVRAANAGSVRQAAAQEAADSAEAAAAFASKRRAAEGADGGVRRITVFTDDSTPVPPEALGHGAAALAQGSSAASTAAALVSEGAASSNSATAAAGQLDFSKFKFSVRPKGSAGAMKRPRAGTAATAPPPSSSSDEAPPNGGGLVAYSSSDSD